MKILVLTSVYPEPDDNREIVTPTVKYFCDKWISQGHKVYIVHNNSSFPIIFYGMPSYIRKKLKAKMGHNFPVLSSRKKLEYELNGVKIFRLPIKKIIPHGKFSKYKLNNQIKKIIRILDNHNFRPDVILSHWVNPQIEIINQLGDIYNAKTSLVFHNDCTKENIKRFNLCDNIKKLSAVGCRNEAYANYVKDIFNLKKKPFVCYSGIPDEIAEIQMKNIDTLTFCNENEFIYVGRLVDSKNVDTIIEALFKKYKNNFRLHIVGVGANEIELRKIIVNLNIENNVVFYGQQTRNKVFEMMRRCKCFIMVSSNETFGMVYLEAMLAGCITIASKNGGIDGVINEDYNGFLSEQGNVDELVKTLDKIDNYAYLELLDIRKNAIKTAYKYSDSEVAKKYLKCVLEC